MISQGFHLGFTAAEKTELWDRWQRGESLKAIGRAFSKPSSSFISSWLRTEGFDTRDLNEAKALLEELAG